LRRNLSRINRLEEKFGGGGDDLLLFSLEIFRNRHKREPNPEEMEFIKADVENMKAQGIYTMIDLITEASRKREHKRIEALEAEKSGNTEHQAEQRHGENIGK
jgi:hypothetical protein